MNFKGIFGSSFYEFLSLSFLSILEKELFGGLREKTLKFHHLFSFLLTQPNTFKKSFHSYFFSKAFHPSYFISKQTHPIKKSLTVVKYQDQSSTKTHLAKLIPQTGSLNAATRRKWIIGNDNCLSRLAPTGTESLKELGMPLKP